METECKRCGGGFTWDCRCSLAERMVGRTFVRIDGGEGDEAMRFVDAGGAFVNFFHKQDCCESVQINDVVGDLADLIGEPIQLAEEVTSDDEPAPEDDHEYESYTWTFYKFATVKGAVTVRWFGTSNGYYSESVSCYEGVEGD